MRLVLLGPPGAGKGTQAGWIQERYGVPHISTGHILRSHIAASTELGAQASEYVDNGKLVPDDVVIKMVIERLSEDDTKEGFILDGFPRTLPQARELDHELGKRGTPLDAVLDLALPDEVVIGRLAHRLECADCKAPYNLVKSPPAVEGVCDRCGGTLVPRNDDKEAKVRRRLEEYHEAVPHLRDFYEAKGLFRRVDADASPGEVRQRVEQALSA